MRTLIAAIALLVTVSAAHAAKSPPKWLAQWQGKTMQEAVMQLGPPMTCASYGEGQTCTWRWLLNAGIWGAQDGCTVTFQLVNDRIVSGSYRGVRVRFHNMCAEYLK
jgi:hypothetical protein